MTLQDFFQNHKKVALGFSGGVDSAYLLFAGKKYHAQIQPYFIKTPFQPEFEWQDANRLALELGVKLITIEYDILCNQQVLQNPSDRCYYCKRELFTVLQNRARQDGYEILLDGTNASDEISDRPGMRAIKELSVKSPLRECGLTKSQIRKLSKEAGLFTWNKPAYACLATRIPTGQALTVQLLQRVELAEARLSEMGFQDFRVRVFHDAARIQWKKDQYQKAVEQIETVREVLNPFFSVILYDTEVR